MDKARVFDLMKEQGHICTCEKLELCPWKNESLCVGFPGLSLPGAGGCGDIFLHALSGEVLRPGSQEVLVS